MDMWNWLLECYKEGTLTLEDLECVIENDKAARDLWEEWANDSRLFIDHVRDEVRPFIRFIKEKKL